MSQQSEETDLLLPDEFPVREFIVRANFASEEDLETVKERMALALGRDILSSCQIVESYVGDRIHLAARVRTLLGA